MRQRVLYSLNKLLCAGVAGKDGLYYILDMFFPFASETKANKKSTKDFLDPVKRSQKLQKFLDPVKRKLKPGRFCVCTNYNKDIKNM